MMKIHLAKLLSLAITCLIFAASSLFAGDKLVVMTESYPPLQYLDKDKMLAGSAIEIFKKLIPIVNKHGNYGLKVTDVKVYPWAKAYKMVQGSKPNRVLFSMTRTEAREKLFKWAGPLINSDLVLFARKDRKIKITSDNDLKNYKFGVVRDDIGQVLLEKEKNIPAKSLQKVSKGELLANLLKGKRVDLVAYGDLTFPYLTRQKTKIDPEIFEIVYTLKKGKLYVAFSKSTDDAVVKHFQDAINQISK